ncbi:Zn-ribbon domain-containing OB-fold protein [Marinicaulis aureus]|uniref:Zn-ribbon domain-containing OB-fold protein n=1 Tax=Hyphococcus aureus TaxID=2666033 RepID=A0ABW1KUI7_9PROT
MGNEGTLWSYTVQRFRPKSPFNGDGDETDFKPYAVGYVELPGEAIIESRIVAADVSQLYIGMPMRLVADVYRTDSDGKAVTTFAFAPIDGERHT